MFFSTRCGAHRDLHSFPTRRSSDLAWAASKGVVWLLVNSAGKKSGSYRDPAAARKEWDRSEEHTSELHHRTISYAVFCLKKKKKLQHGNTTIICITTADYT